MEPRAVDIRDIALWDPIAAYGLLLGIPRVPFAMNTQAIFSTLQVGGGLPVEGDLDTTIAYRTWIDNIQYSVQTPNVFAGNVFKSLFDAMLRFGEPGIAVRVTVLSGPKYLVSPNFTPINNFVQLINSPRWPMGWPLFKQQTIKTEFILTYANGPYAQQAGPLTVTMTYNGWQFLDHTLDEMDPKVAARKLREAGITVPTVECP